MFASGRVSIVKLQGNVETSLNYGYRYDIVRNTLNGGRLALDCKGTGKLGDSVDLKLYSNGIVILEANDKDALQIGKGGLAADGNGHSAAFLFDDLSAGPIPK
ncbi:MAG: hypothetical protein ACRDRT_07580 [Pseudonocardiaceae bacterium]